MPENFDTEQIKVLTALAEVVIGADALTKVPDLIDDIDDFYNYLSPSSKDDLDRILKLLGSDMFMGFLRMVTGVDVQFESFDEMDVDERRRFLDALKSSESEEMRIIYVGLTRLVTTAFYGAASVADEIGYDGVSVDDQSVLDGHRWRPDNPSPVLPCDPPHD